MLVTHVLSLGTGHWGKGGWVGQWAEGRISAGSAVSAFRAPWGALARSLRCAVRAADTMRPCPTVAALAARFMSDIRLSSAEFGEQFAEFRQALRQMSEGLRPAARRPA